MTSTLSAHLPAVVYLQQCATHLLLECFSFLDTNSLLFGLLPAVHSLPAITAAMFNSANGRCTLLSRFGAASDAALWSQQLLDKWRRECFKKQRAGVKPHAHVDREEQRAVRYEVHWAAMFDLQARINRFLVCVMLQPRQQILPQLYTSPPLPPLASPPLAAPGTVRPIYTSVPDLVLQLLLCVPPFHPLPTKAGRHGKLGTDGQLKRFVSNGAPHHVDFAALLYWMDCAERDSDHIVEVLCALYMGPVYAYENEHTADKGVAVDTTELRTLSIEDRRWPAGPPYPLVPLIPHDANRQRAVRQLYIEDVNELPVFSLRWMAGSSGATRRTAPSRLAGASGGFVGWG